MNIATLLSSAAREHGDRPAVRGLDTGLTYRELAVEVSRCATGLAAQGLEPGDRVCLFMKNRVEYVVALLGAFKAGLVAVPTNAKLAGPEVAHIVRDSGARALIHDAATAAAAEVAFAAAPDVHAIGVGPGVAGMPFAELLAAGRPDAPDAEVRPSDLAWLFYTSGTTGRPKGARLSHRNLMATVLNQLANVCRFRAEDRVLHVAPLSHGSGLYLFGSLRSGAEHLIDERPSFSPVETLRTVERERVTVIAFLAPTMIAMLLDADCDADTSSLRCVVYGGGPTLVGLSQRMLDRFGPVFAQIYGMGESPMTITYLPVDAHDRHDPEALASAGVPATGVEVGIVDERGAAVPHGETGIVRVRGDVVTDGYWNDPEATAQALDGAWLRTGDIGRFDDHGRLHLLDRSNDVIITGGTNVYPREVEERLCAHPDVAEAVVFGVPDDLWGERVVAAVVPAHGCAPTADELVAHCRAGMASFKKPTEIHFVEAIPKNAYGKVLRRAVRDQFATPTGVRK